MGGNVLARNPAQGPGGLQGLVARWNDLAKPWRLNVVLYSLTALSLVALVFELVAGEDTAPNTNLASRAAVVTTTSAPSAVVASTTTSPSTSSTTSSTVAPTSTTRDVVRTTVFEPDPEPEPEPEPDPEPEPEETTTTTEPTTTTTEAPTPSSSTTAPPAT